MTAWSALYVPEPVLRRLDELGFRAPTPIQSLTLPFAIRDKQDIIGAAETVCTPFVFSLNNVTDFTLVENSIQELVAHCV